MPDHAIEFMKKSKLVDIYYKIIIIMIENWENETNEKKKRRSMKSRNDGIH